MKQNELRGHNARLVNLNNINIIMGRNGAGKSRFLREIEVSCANESQFYVRYVSPERAGSFKRDGSVITNLNKPTWLRQVRAVNQGFEFQSRIGGAISGGRDNLPAPAFQHTRDPARPRS